MQLELVTPPATPAIETQAVWDHLKLDGTPPDQDLVSAYIDAAIAYVDGDAGTLGRCLITQTWKLTLDCFPGEIEVPLPPIQSVDAVSYIDAAGDEKTLTEGDDYRVIGLNGWGPARVVPAYGKNWPTTQNVAGAVMVEFTAGYGNEPDDVPQPIRQALRLLIGHWYNSREEVVIGTIATQLPAAAENLLAPYRTRYFR